MVVLPVFKIMVQILEQAFGYFTTQDGSNEVMVLYLFLLEYEMELYFNNVGETTYFHNVIMTAGVS